MVSAGRLDRQVTIEQRSDSQDAAGQPIATWSTFATVWAQRRDVSGGERFAASQEIAARSATFRIRWLTGVTEQMRLVDDGTTYDIVGIAGDRRQGWMELACESRDPAAPGSG